ncbi:MAG: hypothetical protein ACFFE4_19160 [Candidatus Thorarchaeota archaeon]
MAQCMQYAFIKFGEVLLKYYLEKLSHNGMSCHPTSTFLEQPGDSQRLPEVII